MSCLSLVSGEVCFSYFGVPTYDIFLYLSFVGRNKDPIRSLKMSTA